MGLNGQLTVVDDPARYKNDIIVHTLSGRIVALNRLRDQRSAFGIGTDW